MTTNHRRRLHPALVRSGRIDVEIEFGVVQAEQVERLFARFYSAFDVTTGLPIGDAPPKIIELAITFAAAISEFPSERKLTSADVSCHLLKYKTSPQAALDNISALRSSGADVVAIE